MISLDFMSADDTLTPIRPGKIGERPFWNTYARQFIYAPAFEFSVVPGAAGYRFHVHDRFGKDHVFSASSPDAPLSSVWNELPAGPVFVEVDAINDPAFDMIPASRKPVLCAEAGGEERRAERFRLVDVTARFRAAEGKLLG